MARMRVFLVLVLAIGAGNRIWGHERIDKRIEEHLQRLGGVIAMVVVVTQGQRAFEGVADVVAHVTEHGPGEVVLGVGQERVLREEDRQQNEFL